MEKFNTSKITQKALEQGAKEAAELAAKDVVKPLAHPISKGAAEAAAKAAAKAAEEAPEVVARTAAEAAATKSAKAATAVRDAKLAVSNEKSILDAAADFAKHNAKMAFRWGIVTKALGMASGVGDVLMLQDSLHQIGQMIHGQDYKFNYGDDIPGWDRIQEHARRSKDEMLRDPEGSKARNRQENDRLSSNNGPPAPVKVEGTVGGKLDILNNIHIEVLPSPLLTALVQQMKDGAARQATLAGSLGPSFSGSNGPVPPSVGHQ